MEKPQIITHIQKSLDFTLFDVQWVPRSARLVVLGSRPKGTGALQIYEMSKGEVKLLKDVEKVTSLKCATFNAANIQTRHLVTGDFEGKICIWDLENIDLPLYCAKGHKEIINCIDGVGGLGVGEGAPEIVSGSRDGTVKVWDPRQKDIPVANMEPIDGEPKRDCWSVAFGNSYNQQERCVCAGYDNGDLKMFDLRTMSLLWETNLKNGICSVEFDRRDIMMNKLVATTLESKFHVFDLRTQHPSKGFSSLSQKAHSSTIWCVSHLPQNRDIWMTTGGNGSLSLWKYSYPAKRKVEDKDKLETGVMGSVNLLQGSNLSTQPISAFSWNRDMVGLAACTSFDQSLRVVIVTKLNKV